MTPFYSEDVLLTKSDLLQKNEDGVTTLLYLKTLYKKDWVNFLERTGITDDESIWAGGNVIETRIWASLRAQTLYRTVDGMMQVGVFLAFFCTISPHSNSHVVQSI